AESSTRLIFSDVQWPQIPPWRAIPPLAGRDDDSPQVGIKLPSHVGRLVAAVIQNFAHDAPCQSLDLRFRWRRLNVGKSLQYAICTRVFLNKRLKRRMN